MQRRPLETMIGRVAQAGALTFKYDLHYHADTDRFLGQRLAEELRRRPAPGAEQPDPSADHS
jgi:hypothetical protein